MNLEEKLEFEGKDYKYFMGFTHLMSRYLNAENKFIEDIKNNKKNIIIPVILRNAYSVKDKPIVETHFEDCIIYSSQIKNFNLNTHNTSGISNLPELLVQTIKQDKTLNYNQTRYFDIYSGEEIYI